MGVCFDEGKQKWVATFQDKASRDRVKTHKNRLQVELTMIDRAGPNSRHELGDIRLIAYAYKELGELRDRGGSQTTIEKHLTSIELHISQLLEMGVAKVTSEMLGAAADAWEGDDQTPGQIYDRQYFIERVFELAWRVKAIHGNPARDAFAHRRPELPPLKTAVLPTDWDIADLREVATELRHRALLELTLATFPNEQELRALKREDINFDAGDTGEVHYGYTLDGGHEVEQPNAYRDRRLPLEDARPWLEAWLASPEQLGSEYVFPNVIGGRSSKSMVNYELRRLQYLAELAGDEDRRRKPRVEMRNRPLTRWEKFLPRYGMKDLGTVAVLAWYRMGHRGHDLAERVGCSLRGLRRYQPLFDELGHDHEAVRRAGRMLRDGA